MKSIKHEREGIIMENVSQLKVNELVDLVSPLFASSELGKEIPSLMLWGPPGIGKSQAIREISRRVEKITSKTVNVTDVRLLLFNPVDLRGIPTSDADKKFAIWLKPKIFQMDESPNVINILFLDEISAAPASVQAAAYQITLDRVVGEHKLPENCFVIAAGNRVTDKSVVTKMPKALGNRMTHVEIISDIDDWKKWAIPKGIDSRIIGYLNFKNTALFAFNPSTDDVAFPSPRSWEMVDKYLKKGELNAMLPLIAGSIGLGAATEFRGWVKVYDKLPNIKDILAGKDTQAPKDPDVLYALSSSIVVACAKADKKEIGNVIKYTLTMPAEFSTLTVKDMLLMDDLKMKMVTMPEWVEWSKVNRKFIM